MSSKSEIESDKFENGYCGGGDGGSLTPRDGKLEIRFTTSCFEKVDKLHSIVRGWTDNSNNPLLTPSFLLDSLVKQGFLGVKTGRGFYEYNHDESKKNNQ